jgi:hypothetical protein
MGITGDITLVFVRVFRHQVAANAKGKILP